MEAGYDYLLLRRQPQRRFLNFSGIFLLILGAMLLATSGAYYGYTAKAQANLDSLNATLPESVSGTAEESNLQSASSSQQVIEQGSVEIVLVSGPQQEMSREASLDRTGQSPSPSTGRTSGQATGEGFTLPVASAPARQGASPSWVYPASAIGSQQLFPGESLQASFWSNPLSYESASYRERVLLQGFASVDPSEGLTLGSTPPATRLIVPSIDVDSAVTELAILDLGGSRAYETPNNVVGHIPETADAGEADSSWFFGHTESPILGEGSVFFNLSKIPGKLQNGEDVFVITDNGEHQFLYRITSSKVVHQRDMRLYDTGYATIHLVSCVPRLVYDHRLIVTGELIGKK